MKEKFQIPLCLLIAVVLFDQLTKWIAFRSFEVFFNYGLIFHSFADAPFLYRNILVSSFFGFVFFFYLMALYVFPTRLKAIRYGSSLFVGGVGGNVIDKVVSGRTIDFLVFPLGRSEIITFNFADLFQWIGFGLMILFLYRHGMPSWRDGNHRSSLLVRPKDQWNFVFKLSFVAGSALFMLGIFSFSFVSFLIRDSHGESGRSLASNENLLLFGCTYLILSLLFTTCVAVGGIFVSHQVYGPVHAFSLFVRKVLQSKARSETFSLREGDQNQELVSLANEIRDRIESRPKRSKSDRKKS